MDIVKEKIKYEDIIAELEKKTTVLAEELSKERSHSEGLQKRLTASQTENESLRSLSADLRAHLRSGLSGLIRPESRPSSVPALGDVTRRVLGVKNNEDEDDDSAIDDPNTESLKSKAVPGAGDQAPVSTASPPTRIPSDGAARIAQAQKTRIPSSSKDAQIPPGQVTGISQLRMSRSPVRNLFPETHDVRAQSRSSTLVDADSLQEDKGNF